MGDSPYLGHSRHDYAMRYLAVAEQHGLLGRGTGSYHVGVDYNAGGVTLGAHEVWDHEVHPHGRLKGYSNGTVTRLRIEKWGEREDFHEDPFGTWDRDEDGHVHVTRYKPDN